MSSDIYQTDQPIGMFAHTHTRSTHPATSRKAAERAGRGVRQVFIDILARLDQHPGGLIAEQFPERERKRLRDCCRAGLIAEAGERKNSDGNDCIVWKQA